MASLEVNKILAAVLTAGILATGSGFLGSLFYSPEEDPEEDAFPIALPEGDGGGAAEEEPEAPLGVLLASADAGAGEGEARACTACHNFEQGGAAQVGPPLYGVLGRQIAAWDGFAYSDALAGKSEEVWDWEHMNAFLENPQEYAPGTKMSYAGLRDPEDRADLLMYLQTVSPEAPPVPAPEAAEAQVAEAETPGADPEPEVPASEDVGADEAIISSPEPPGAPENPEAADDPGADVPVPPEEVAEEMVTDEEVEDAVTAVQEPDATDGESSGDQRTAERVLDDAAEGAETGALVAEGEDVRPLPAAGSATPDAEPVLEAPADAPPDAVDTDVNDPSLLSGGQAPVAGQAEPNPGDASPTRSVGDGSERQEVLSGEAPGAGQGETTVPTEGGEVDTTQEAEIEQPSEDGEVGETVIGPGGDEASAGQAEGADVDVVVVAQADTAAAAGDPEAGAKVFRQCQACHVVDQEQNRVGPHLVGVVGRPVAAVEGFNYSDAMVEYGGEWSEDRLAAYLADPRGVVQGTKMAFAGLRKDEDITNVIAYLKSEAP